MMMLFTFMGAPWLGLLGRSLGIYKSDKTGLAFLLPTKQGVTLVVKEWGQLPDISSEIL